MTNSERKKLAQKKAFAKQKRDEKKEREFQEWNNYHRKRIEEEKQIKIDRLKKIYNDDLSSLEIEHGEKNQNCLYLLKRDFKISYAYMADLFGYKKGYLYSFTSGFDEVPLPLQRFCMAYRRIKTLEKELENYKKIKNLFADLLGSEFVAKEKEVKNLEF